MIVDELYDYAKSLDETRLVLDNATGRSPYTINLIGNHAKTDIDDVGFMGPGSPAWIQGVEKFRKYCARIVEHGRPVTHSLMHNLTSRIFDLNKVRQRWSGKAPWWFTAPQGVRGSSTIDLTGFEDRFFKWGLDRIYGDFGRFANDSDRYRYEGLKFQVEEMRKNPDIQGYLSFIYDCAPHVIGAIDVFRDRKAMFDELAGIYTQDLVMLDCLRRNFWSGENVRADIHFSHYGGEEANDCVAKWWLEGFGIDGKISGVAVERGDVRNVGEIRSKAPAVDAARVARLYVQLMKEDKSLSKNYIVFPQWVLRAAQRITISTPLRLISFVVRVLLGSVIILAAGSTQFPLTLKIMGILVIGKGVTALLLGNSKSQSLLDWFLSRLGQNSLRAGGIVGLLFGGFLILCCCSTWIDVNHSSLESTTGSLTGSVLPS